MNKGVKFKWESTIVKYKEIDGELSFNKIYREIGLRKLIYKFGEFNE